MSKNGATRTRAETRKPTKAAAKANGPAGSAAAQYKRLLTDQQIGQIVEMKKDVESIELKLTIPANVHRTTVRALGLDPVESEPRQVFFFDTQSLALNKAGIIVRARRIRGGTADTVVKMRPVVPAELPDDFKRSEACKVELDILPGGFVCSASVKGDCSGEEVNDVVTGGRALSKTLSKEQRAFFKKHGPKGVDLNGLTALGPTFVLRSRKHIKRLDRKVTAEMWLYPDNTRVLELSIKSTPDELFHVAGEFRAYLAQHGIDTTGFQETKTANALRYFCTEMRGRK
jgi:hypothetical protein